MKVSKSALLFVGASFGALVAAAPAWAQTASISIAVLSPDVIANAGVTQAANLSSVVAGLQIGQGGR